MKKKVFYFGLEPLKARYTYQLSKEWMPATFAEYDNLEFIDVPGEFDPDQQIKVGANKLTSPPRWICSAVNLPPAPRTFSKYG